MCAVFGRRIGNIESELVMAEPKYTVAIIGCGRLGQHYAEVYRALHNTELVARRIQSGATTMLVSVLASRNSIQMPRPCTVKLYLTSQ